MVTITLDGTQYASQPKQLQDLREVIYLDTELYGWGKRYEGLDITFTGDAFEYILGRKNLYGYNVQIDVGISIVPEDVSQESDYIRGYINLKDCKFNHTEQSVECKIIEQHYEAVIREGSKKWTTFRTANALDGRDISSYTPTEITLSIVAPSTGIVVDTCKAWDIFECLEMLVKYISNDQLQYRDDWYATSEFADSEHSFCLTSGNELRVRTGNIIAGATFEEIMTFLHHHLNLWWYIDYSTETPTFVLDSWQNITDQDPAITYENVKNIEETFLKERMYTRVRVGNTQEIPVAAISGGYIATYRGFTHVVEEYGAKESLMEDRTFDISTDIITGHNLLNAIYINATSTFDYYKVCFQYSVSGNVTVAGTYGNTTTAASTRQFNEALLNQNVLLRHPLPVDFGFQTGSTDQNFEVYQGTQRGSYTIVSTATQSYTSSWMDTETSDPAGVYALPSSRYQPTKTGFYSFEFHLSLRVVSITGTMKVTMHIRHRTAAATRKNYDKVFYVTAPTGTENLILKHFAGFLMHTTETGGADQADVWAEVTMTDGTAVIYFQPIETKWLSRFVAQQGGTAMAQLNPLGYYGSSVKFKKVISLSDWKTMKSPLATQIAVQSYQKGFNARVIPIEVSRNIVTGEMEYEGMTSLITVSQG